MLMMLMGMFLMGYGQATFSGQVYQIKDFHVDGMEV